MNKRVTLKDVAKAASVHVSTVSRALSPHTSTSLSKDVADRIKAVAKELGYRPNRIAAGLRTNRSMTVGVMIPDITNTLFPPIVRGIEGTLEPLGYATILVNTDNLPEREHRLIDVLRERGVDGIITAAARRDDPGIAELVKLGIPVVSLNRRLDMSAVPFVINDDNVGMNLLLKHFFDLGHRRIGHVAGPRELSTGQSRAAAFSEGCKALGLPECADLISYSDRFEEAEGERCSVELLRSHPQITALLCGNDRLAIGAYSGIKSLGLRVPEDVSVTGFNDSPMLESIPPRLTTIRIQKYEIGRVGAELLLQALQGDARGGIGTVLPVELIIGDSTCAPKTES